MCLRRHVRLFSRNPKAEAPADPHPLLVGPRLACRGLPRHQYGLVGCPSLESEPNAWSDALKQPDTLGTCITMPLKVLSSLAASGLVPRSPRVDTSPSSFSFQRTTASTSSPRRPS